MFKILAVSQVFRKCMMQRNHRQYW